MHPVVSIGVGLLTYSILRPRTYYARQNYFPTGSLPPCSTLVTYADGHIHGISIPSEELRSIVNSNVSRYFSMSIVNNHSHVLLINSVEARRLLNGESRMYRSGINGRNPHWHSVTVGCMGLRDQVIYGSIPGVYR
jgi:hypothetical protein